jgi:hypothetical protein
MAHQFLLNGQLGPDWIEPRAIAVAWAVHSNAWDACPIGGVLERAPEQRIGYRQRTKSHRACENVIFRRGELV